MKQLPNDKFIPKDRCRSEMYEVARNVLNALARDPDRDLCDHIAVLVRYGFAMIGDEEMGRSIQRFLYPPVMLCSTCGELMFRYFPDNVPVFCSKECENEWGAKTKKAPADLPGEPASPRSPTEQ